MDIQPGDRVAYRLSSPKAHLNWGTVTSVLSTHIDVLWDSNGLLGFLWWESIDAHEPKRAWEELLCQGK